MYRGFTLILPTFLEARLSSLTFGVRTAISSFLPSHSTVSIDTLTANVIAGIVYIVGIVGQVLGGRVADRFSLKWGYLTFFIAALPFIVLTELTRSAVLIPMAGLYVFFSFGMQPIENSLIAALTPARWRSVSYGVKFTLSFGAGSLAVMLMSAVSSRYGVGSSLWVVVIFVVLVILNTIVFLAMSRGQEIRQ
jgi:MFS family permease